MCGIAGYFYTDGSQVTDTATILSMLEVQKHRGPDDSGVRVFSLSSGISSECGITSPVMTNGGFEGIIGFNRLSILDLSANGHQPMVSPDGNVILTLNGELYNAFDYKDDLEKWGYRFRSTTDTEVALALYLRYGFEGMIQRLNGMFAIVVVDLTRKELYITRDRFGIKPMYFYRSANLFAFSSELKSFGAIKGFTFRLKEDQIDEYLIFRNNFGGTLFMDVDSLEPGHYIRYSHGTSSIKRRFFDVNGFSRSGKAEGDLRLYGERMKEWLGRSVKSQLMSDVKLGCQLSGGIDSSLVTWLANRNSQKGNFEAVSIVFHNDLFSEEKYIDTVAERLSIQSHKFTLDADYYLSAIRKATWHLEAPLNHPNTVAIYKLSQRARDYVTVLLSGEGADEVFGGYSRFYDIGFPFNRNRVLHEIRKNIWYPREMAGYLRSENRAVMATAFMTPAMASSLRPGFSRSRAVHHRLSLYETLSGSLFDRQVKYELLTYLPDLLIRQDKMSMAHSIENRVPFLDNDVVENAFTIPEEYLLLRQSPEGKNTEKYLLKKIAADVFGHEFGFREKMGFGIPVREFFSSEPFLEYLRDSVLPGIKERGIFNNTAVKEWLENLNGLKYYEMEALWVVIAFEIWASVYLD